VRWFDAGELPDEFVALVDALGPAEDLVITRDGRPIARLSGIADMAGERVGRSRSSAVHVTVVATAMRLSRSVRTNLSALLGPDYIVLDVNSAPRTADVLLAPPVSPQLIGSLRAMFPEAKVIIAEIEDVELGVSHRGPVRRLLDAGAHSYLPPSSISALAERLGLTIAQLRQVTGASPTLTGIDVPGLDPADG
jgi:antitoxin (DNA-binding transcriptional repressor) of toxin-antitoxin stability system